MYDPTSDPDGDEQHPLTRDGNERVVEEERRELQAADDAERAEMEACARLEEEAEERDRFARIAAVLRDVIERQVTTTTAGQLIAESCPNGGALLANLVGNIVGNLTYAVDNLIEDALAASKE